MPVSYEIGTGIGEVTDPAVGLPLQGMVDEDQIATGVESPLYARAFVVAERPSVADGGMCRDHRGRHLGRHSPSEGRRSQAPRGVA